MSPEKIKELREKFFDDLTRTKEMGITGDFSITEFKTMPHNVFQWIVDNVIKAKEEENCLEHGEKYYLMENDIKVCYKCAKPVSAN